MRTTGAFEGFAFFASMTFANVGNNDEVIDERCGSLAVLAFLYALLACMTFANVGNINKVSMNDVEVSPFLPFSICEFGQ